MSSKAQKFSEAVELFVINNKDVSYLDSLEYHCDLANIEYEAVLPLVTKSLKDKLTLEAQNYNILPKSSKLNL